MDVAVDVIGAESDVSNTAVADGNATPRFVSTTGAVTVT